MLTVLNVAYPFAPVGPDAVGGAEQILSAIDAAATAAGHRSLVLACEGSRSAGRLHAFTRPKAPLTPEVLDRFAAWLRSQIERIIEREGVDIVHFHGIGFERSVPRGRTPVLATLHLPPAWYTPAIFAPARPNTWLNCVSRSQRKACPRSAALIEDIPNGVISRAFSLSAAATAMPSCWGASARRRASISRWKQPAGLACLS